MTTEEQIEAQGFRCRGARGESATNRRRGWRAFRPFRHHQRCEYDGFVYCDACAGDVVRANSLAHPARFRFPTETGRGARRFRLHRRRPSSIWASSTRVSSTGRSSQNFVTLASARAEIEAARRRVSRASLEGSRRRPRRRRRAAPVVDGDFDPELFALDVLRDVQKHKHLAVARVDRVAASCARARRLAPPS